MDFIKKFKQDEAEKKKLIKTLNIFIKNFATKYFGNVTVKETSFFEYKIRVEDIATSRGLYHLFIQYNVPYNVKYLFDFRYYTNSDLPEPISAFNTAFQIKFENITISDKDKVSFAKIEDFNNKRNLFEQDLKELEDFYNEIFEKYKVLLFKQIEYYTDYYAESTFGFNRHTIKKFILDNSLVDGIMPVLTKYDVYMCNEYNKAKGKFYNSSSTNIGKQILEYSIEDENLKIEYKIDFNNDYVAKVHKIELFNIKELFDFKNLNRIDIAKIKIKESDNVNELSRNIEQLTFKSPLIYYTNYVQPKYSNTSYCSYLYKIKEWLYNKCKDINWVIQSAYSYKNIGHLDNKFDEPVKIFLGDDISIFSDHLNIITMHSILEYLNTKCPDRLKNTVDEYWEIDGIGLKKIDTRKNYKKKLAILKYEY